MPPHYHIETLAPLFGCWTCSLLEITGSNVSRQLLWVSAIEITCYSGNTRIEDGLGPQPLKAGERLLTLPSPPLRVKTIRETLDGFL
jgi:hypothetical protein